MYVHVHCILKAHDGSDKPCGTRGTFLPRVVVGGGGGSGECQVGINARRTIDTLQMHVTRREAVCSAGRGRGRG